MRMTTKALFLLAGLIIIAGSCKKDKEPKEPVPGFAEKNILYLVKGTHLKLNYIDSESVFQRDQVFQDSFRYEFRKGPGASIGITINRQSASDTIYSWHIFINGKLYANAFSEGGVYLTVPYD